MQKKDKCTQCGGNLRNNAGKGNCLSLRCTREGRGGSLRQSLTFAGAAAAAAAAAADSDSACCCFCSSATDSTAWLFHAELPSSFFALGKSAYKSIARAAVSSPRDLHPKGYGIHNLTEFTKGLVVVGLGQPSRSHVVGSHISFTVPCTSDPRTSGNPKPSSGEDLPHR